MAYVGLVPSEHSSGDRRRLGAITKAGNARVRHTLVIQVGPRPKGKVRAGIGVQSVKSF